VKKSGVVLFNGRQRVRLANLWATGLERKRLTVSTLRTLGGGRWRAFQVERPGKQKLKNGGVMGLGKDLTLNLGT